jgi:hypothetical protein
MKFNRLGQARQQLALAARLDQDSKRTRQILLGTLRKALELTGTLSTVNRGIMYQLVKFIEQGNLNLYMLLDDWLLNSPRLRSLSPAQRPKLFYRYIRYERLNKEEQLTRMGYLEVLKRFTSSRLLIPDKEFKGLEFSERVGIWFGKSVGNLVEDVLIDFLVITFTEVSKFNKSLLYKPRTILGDFGWRVFDSWVIENYGGVTGYALPTKAERTRVTLQRNNLIELAKTRYQALERGDVEEFDRLGKEL